MIAKDTTTNRHLQRTRLVAQAYSLYAGLRYHFGSGADEQPAVQHAYARYARRVRNCV